MAHPTISLDAIRQPAFLYDADGVVSAANRAAERLVGRSPVGLSAEGLAEQLGLRLSDGRPRAFCGDTVRQALLGEESTPLKGEATAADGSVIAVLVTTSPIGGDGRTEGALSVWHDVTETERVERKHAFHALLLDRIHDAVIATDTDLRVTAWNRAAEDLYGWTAEEAIGRFAREVTGAVTSEAERQEHLAQLGREGALQHRILQHHRDGRLLVVDGRSAPIRDSIGTLVGYVAVNRDVTERERLREELAETEAKYRNLVELAPDAILIHCDGTIVFANPAAVAMLGIDGPDEIVGRQILDIVHPRTREHVEWNIEADLRGERSPLTTVDILRPDGTTITVQGRGAMIPYGGHPAIQVVLRDVTEEMRAEAALRESEERLRNVLALSLDAIYRKDLVTGRYDYISPVNEQITGYCPEEFATFSLEAYDDMVHPEDRARVRDALTRRRGSHSGTIEYRFRCQDGSYRWLADHFLAQTDEEGRPRSVTGVVRDVTKQWEDQESILRFADDLKRSNEELQRFAYVASHDLQEPLRSIVSFSQLLERRLAGHADKDVGEFLEFIIEGGVRMQALILDLLQISRLETQARPPQPTDAGQIVASVLSSLETAICEAGATIAVGPMPTVMADRTQLEQVFSNLVGNALKYRRQEVPLEIRISADRTNGSWQFAVADNGIGIEAQYFERIFVIFQRLHTKERYEGTGIGLAVVKKIVERHGGRCWVASEPGEGSTFLFTLPAA